MYNSNPIYVIHIAWTDIKYYIAKVLSHFILSVKGVLT